jgi:hypothetical protein
MNAIINKSSVDNLGELLAQIAELTKQADALIANFKKGIPDKSIAFQFNKKDGDRYTIGCWINETVTVRFY